MIIIDRQLIRSLWSHKIAYKIFQKYIYICVFLLKNVIAILRYIFQYCVSNTFFMTNSAQYQKIYLKIKITFLSNKKKYIQDILFYATKNFKSIISTVQYQRQIDEKVENNIYCRLRFNLVNIIISYLTFIIRVVWGEIIKFVVPNLSLTYFLL